MASGNPGWRSPHGCELSWQRALLRDECVFSKTNPPSRLILGVMQDMDVLHRNITEALRMHPPLIMVLR